MKAYFSVNCLRTAVGIAALGLCGVASALNYDVNFTETPPVIDGFNTDAAWASASAPMTDFRTVEDINASSQQQTFVRLLWDNDYLYVLYEASDNFPISLATSDDVNFYAGQDQMEMFLDPSWGQHLLRVDRVYHIAVDAGLAGFTYTAAGLNETGWDLSDASSVAVAHVEGGNWNVEMALAWSDLNSAESLSPGVVSRAPIHNTIWGGQFGRTHSMISADNNTATSKWNAVNSGVIHRRPLGTLTFKGGPEPGKPDLSDRHVNQAFTFEDPMYVPGSTVDDIDGWSTSRPEIFLASDARAANGSKSLQIVASESGRTLNRDNYYPNTETAQYVQYALWLPSEQINSGDYRHVLYLRGAYEGGTEDTLGQVWFRNIRTEGSNVVGVQSHEDPNDESALSRTNLVGLVAYDTWMTVTAKVDPVEKTFEVWLNDYKLHNTTNQTDKFTVRDRSTFEQLKYARFYSKNYGVEPVYVDDVVYYRDISDSRVTDWQLF